MEPEKTSNTIAPNLYKVLGESTALFASTFAVSKTPLISWLNTPSTPEGLALCTGVNACTSAVTDAVNQVYNHEGDASYRLAFQVAGLLSSFALLTAFAKPIAARTGMALNPYALAQLTAFQGIVKAIIYVGYTFAQSFTALKTIANIDDMKKVPNTDLGLRKKQFEERQTETWDSYTVNMQAAFNLKLKANGQALLSFTSQKTDGELSKEELEIYLESVGEKPTVEQAKILIAHDVPPPAGCDVFPGLSPDCVIVDKLSDTELRWYHSALCQKPEKLNSTQYKAFAKAFYRLDLSPPNENFGLATVPESAKDLTKIQANYYVNYYLAHMGDYQNLEPKQQLTLREIFRVADAVNLLLITAPKKEDLLSQPKEVLEQLSFQYDAESNLWDILTPEYQEAFNVALENHKLPARKLTTQPWSTTKKVAVYVGAPVLIIGAVFGLTWLGLAYRASIIQPNSSQNNDNDTDHLKTPDQQSTETSFPSTALVSVPLSSRTFDKEKIDLRSFFETHPAQQALSTIENVNSGQDTPVGTQQMLPTSETATSIYENRTTLLTERTIIREELDCKTYAPSEMKQLFTNASLTSMCKDGFTDTGLGCFQVDPIMQQPALQFSTTVPPSNFSSQTPYANESLPNLDQVNFPPTGKVVINGEQELTGRVTVQEPQTTSGTVWNTASETMSKVSVFWNDTVYPTASEIWNDKVYPSARSGFSKYIWSFDGAEVRANYNAEIAQGYQDLPCGKAAFDALKEGTPISKECVEAAVAFREEVKTKYQDDSAYLQAALIQDRQLYEYHFQNAWNKGEYKEALQALWAGLRQVWKTKSANPTIANLEAMGKSPGSIACGAFATNKDINKQLGIEVPEVDCRGALPKQARAPRGWSAPAVYIAPQAISGAYIGYKAIQKLVWPILSTLGSLLFCCNRRRKKSNAASFDHTHWLKSDFKLSKKSFAPNTFEKVDWVMVGAEKVQQADFKDLPSKLNTYLDNNTPGTWQAALKLIALKAVHDTDEGTIHWASIGDQRLAATITKAADDKVTIVAQAIGGKTQHEVKMTYDSPAKMREAARVLNQEKKPS